jgi:hypothetical protein
VIALGILLDAAVGGVAPERRRGITAGVGVVEQARPCAHAGDLDAVDVDARAPACDVRSASMTSRVGTKRTVGPAYPAVAPTIEHPA